MDHSTSEKDCNPTYSIQPTHEPALVDDGDTLITITSAPASPVPSDVDVGVVTNTPVLNAQLEILWQAKWQILLCVSMSWFAIYHCLSAIAVIEDTLLTNYNMSNTQFSFLSSVVFLLSIPGCFFTIKLVNQYDVYNTLIITALTVTVGQSIFLVGCIMADIAYKKSNNTANNNINPDNYLIVMYIGRSISGFAQGLADVLVLLMTKLWFENTKWLETANMVVGTVMVELGTLSARYTIDKIYEMNNLLWQSYLLGWLLCIVSLIAGFIAKFIEKDVDIKLGNKDLYKYNKNNSKKNNKTVETDDCKNDNKDDESLSKLIMNGKKLPLDVWLIIMTLSVAASTFFMIYTQLTKPLMIIFDITQYEADLILSGAPVIAVFFVPLWSWIGIKKPNWNGKIYIAGMMAMFVGLGMIIVCYITKIENKIGLFNPIPWSALLIVNFGLAWVWAFGWPLLYEKCPQYLQASMTSITTVVYCGCSMIVIQMFGIVADITGTYLASLLMVDGLCLIGVLISCKLLD